jgi:hypothetical protein
LLAPVYQGRTRPGPAPGCRDTARRGGDLHGSAQVHHGDPVGDLPDRLQAVHLLRLDWASLYRARPVPRPGDVDAQTFGFGTNEGLGEVLERVPERHDDDAFGEWSEFLKGVDHLGDALGGHAGFGERLPQMDAEHVGEPNGDTSGVISKRRYRSRITSGGTPRAASSLPISRNDGLRATSSASSSKNSTNPSSTTRLTISGVNSTWGEPCQLCECHRPRLLVASGPWGKRATGVGSLEPPSTREDLPRSRTSICRAHSRRDRPAVQPRPWPRVDP